MTTEDYGTQKRLSQVGSQTKRRALLRVACAGALFATVGTPTTAQAAEIFVDADAADGGNGQTWCTAKNDLWAVMDTASSGDIIRVAAGVYLTIPCDPFPCAPTSQDRNEQFNLHANVSVYGGYAGCGEPDARDPLLYETILKRRPGP